MANASLHRRNKINVTPNSVRYLTDKLPLLSCPHRVTYFDIKVGLFDSPTFIPPKKYNMCQNMHRI